MISVFLNRFSQPARDEASRLFGHLQRLAPSFVSLGKRSQASLSVLWARLVAQLRRRRWSAARLFGRLRGLAPSVVSFGKRSRDSLSALRARLVVALRPKPLSPARVALLVAAFAALSLSAVELRTSAIQSRFLSQMSSRLTWSVGPGASEAIRFPGDGPFDLTRGYSRIPDFRSRLQKRRFRVVSQARFSEPLLFTTSKLGLNPPATEKAVAGLVLFDKDGNKIYDATAGVHRFKGYEDIPPIVIECLLAMEDQHIRSGSEKLNPAVDWGRLGRATLLSGASKVGLPVTFQGGSTLAIQMEKYRHSDGGRTKSITDKMRQVADASLRAYHGRADVRATQRRIVLDYVNSVPLGGAPGYGEVHGLGEGLRAWFGLDPDSTFAVLRDPSSWRAEARALKPVLALLCGVRAPTRLLGKDPQELERRVSFYENKLREDGVLKADLARRLTAVPIRTVISTPRVAEDFDRRRTVDATRLELMRLLAVPSLQELDKLDLEVHTSFDSKLQADASHLFRELGDEDYVYTQGFTGERLLATGAPSGVTYSLVLFERTPEGDVTRVRADNLDQPFDPNTGMRLELGSTAKLRTTAHYLEVIERIRNELVASKREGAEGPREHPWDPLTAWVARELESDPDMPLDSLLDHALERTYSANPWEVFFTGGGVHVFRNFEPSEDHRTYSVREAFVRSTNLVFIRLMRDLVRYHEARLPYDTRQVLDGEADSLRARMLAEAADDEARAYLRRAYRSLKGANSEDVPRRLLGQKASARKLAILYCAWHRGASPESLRSWLAAHGVEATPEEAQKLAAAYDRPELSWLDFGYLLDRHPLELWCARELERDPSVEFDELVAKSGDVRAICNAWLFQRKQWRAQDTRLRIRMERDAFARMTEDWRRLGFPFERLVPSLATAIGSSADRPEALAELAGIIAGDGLRRPASLIRSLRFGAGTPYETSFVPAAPAEERVMSAAAARVLRSAMAGVVERGTARRIDGAFRLADAETLVVGGKTGSGDNRIQAVAQNGARTSSKAVNRTATFVFYIGDRYYGVVTATVLGRHAEEYSFTSALPVEVLKRLAPQISERLEQEKHGPLAREARAKRAGNLVSLNTTR